MCYYFSYTYYEQSNALNYLLNFSIGLKCIISRDHKGVGMAHEINHPKNSLNFPDNDEAVLVR